MMTHNGILNNWVQNFAVNTLPVLSNPPAKDMWQAINKYLPDELAKISVHSRLVPKGTSYSDFLQRKANLYACCINCLI